MAGISKKTYKTKKGTITRYVITYRDIYGKQHTAGNYATKKEALKDINNFEDIETSSKEITMGYIFNVFLERAEKKYALNTIETYKTYYQKYFKHLDNISYNKLNSIMLQKLFDEIELKSPYIAETCLKFAKAAVNYSIKHSKRIKNNIFNEIEKIKLPKADINHLTIQELFLVLDGCKEYFPDYYVMLFTFIGTGLREGELIALEKEDFNKNYMTIDINKQYTRNEFKAKTKTINSTRRIAIFEILANILEEHIKTLPADCKLLFPNKAGNYHNPSNLRERFWKPLLRKCGITKRVRLHDLRGSYTDLTLSSGLSVKFTQNQLGHAKAETTTNIYARNNEDMISIAKNRINNIFEKKCEHNVSIKQENADKKIILFPRNKTGKGF